MSSISARRGSPRRRPIGDWREVYFAAVLETDGRHAMLKILSARKAMQDRLLELQVAASISPDELRDLQSALTYLDILFSYLEESASAERLSAIA